MLGTNNEEMDGTGFVFVTFQVYIGRVRKSNKFLCVVGIDTMGPVLSNWKITFCSMCNVTVENEL